MSGALQDAGQRLREFGAQGLEWNLETVLIPHMEWIKLQTVADPSQEACDGQSMKGMRSCYSPL